jgi:putrescine transport system substrate-binding protein
MSERQDPDRVSLAFVFDQQSPRFSRRSFLGTMAFAGAAGLLAACGSDSDSGSPAPGATSAPNNSGAKALNFYNWTDYVDPDKTIQEFESRTGIKVTYDNYTSNDELVAKLSAGGAGYDLIVPTDSTMVQLRNGELLQEIDHANVPNLKNLDERFQNPEYDPDNKYSVPWQWGTTGIGYDPTKVDGEVTDWDAFNLASVRGKSSILDEGRDAMGMALFALGLDPNTTNDDDLDQAQQYLIELKAKIQKITSEYKQPLTSGELLLAHAYSGDVFQAQVDNENLEYVIPASGAFSWVDVMAIPQGAPHKENAEAFMNYILEPEVGAALTNYVQYGSPNKAAEQFIDEEVTSNPLIYPPADVLARLPFQKDLGEDELKYGDRWTTVKNS